VDSTNRGYVVAASGRDCPSRQGAFVIPDGPREYNLPPYPVHEPMRSRGVSIGAHDIADTIDAEHLRGGRIQNGKRAILAFLRSNKPVLRHGISNCVSLIVTPRADNIASWVSVPSSREQVAFECKCGDDSLPIRDIAHTGRGIKTNNLPGR